MNSQQKIFKFFLVIFYLFGFVWQQELQAQSVSTYYNFKSDVQYPNVIKADTSGNLYFLNYDINWTPRISKLSANGTLSNIVSGNYYPQTIAPDNAGNVYFTDGSNWPPDIKKVASDGTITTFLSGDYYAQDMTFDSAGNLYFADLFNSPEIKKITPDGNITSFVTGNFYPISMLFDPAGNLFYIDGNSWPPPIQKFTPDGTMSTFVSGNYNPMNFTIDTAGNMYFLDGYNYPSDIKKVAPDGTVTSYVTTGINNANGLTIDKDGNLYFIDELNGQYSIKTIRNPLAPCVLPQPPAAGDTSVCLGSSITISAEGIGEIQWYDAPTGGNLVGSGSSLIIPPISSNTTYYAEAYFCNLSTTRTPVYITVEPIPVLTISGSTTGNDFVKLTASGGVYYSWSGGYSPTTATNTFTNSSTYMVTVTNAEGCSDNASVTVTVNKYGVTENGQLVSDVMTQLSRNGQPNATSFVNKHGKSSSSVPTDGQLNFSVFGTGSACAANAGDLTNLTVPVNQTSSGTKSANALLDWSSWNVLSAAGVSVPNGGDYFAVAASGYFVPEETGNYTFTCEGDDAVDLFINNINVANHYGCHGIAGLGSHIGTIYLEQGTRYSFRARMQENGGGEGIRVFWRKPSESSGWNVYPSEITSN